MCVRLYVWGGGAPQAVANAHAQTIHRYYTSAHILLHTHTACVPPSSSCIQHTHTNTHTYTHTHTHIHPHVHRHTRTHIHLHVHVHTNNKITHLCHHHLSARMLHYVLNCVVTQGFVQRHAYGAHAVDGLRRRVCVYVCVLARTLNLAHNNAETVHCPGQWRKRAFWIIANACC